MVILKPTSIDHDEAGQARRARTGFLDSLFTSALYNDTAHVREIKNVNENQKYTVWEKEGIGLNRLKSGLSLSIGINYRNLKLTQESYFTLNF